MRRRQRLGGDNAAANAALGGYKKAAHARKSADRSRRAVLGIVSPTLPPAESRVLATLSRKDSNSRVEKRLAAEIANKAFNAMDQLGSPGAVACRSGYEFFRRLFSRARVGPSCSPRREPTKIVQTLPFFVVSRHGQHDGPMPLALQGSSI
jgi:hypothetical protein